MHVVIAFIALLCYIASIFHVLTRLGLQRIMLQTFQTKSKVRWVVVLHTAMSLELMDSFCLRSLPVLCSLDGLQPYYDNKYSL